ncbi:MAG: DUF502 domain-containing protein [Simkaniaceae bacterium]|nr:MAG: DUF502 domain-containing protein [Simkaniaceae bacterium]
MKKTFLAGLATLLPIAVTFFVILFIVDFLTAPFVGIVEDLITHHGTTELAAQHKYLLLFASRIIVLILFLVLVFILGILGRKIFFSWFINLTHRIFYKIPIIKTIYKITREISNSVFSEKKKALFKGTVAVPFPNEKAKALGLLSGSPPDEVGEKKKNLQTVFVPTSPHPISGFLMMYEENEVQKTTIETEDLFKFLLSCGMYHPGEEKK